MPTDIYFNGTTYPGRSGNDKYGTFYTQCKPPQPLVAGANVLVNGDFSSFTGTPDDNLMDIFTGWTFIDGDLLDAAAGEFLTAPNSVKVVSDPDITEFSQLINSVIANASYTLTFNYKKKSVGTLQLAISDNNGKFWNKDTGLWQSTLYSNIFTNNGVSWSAGTMAMVLGSLTTSLTIDISVTAIGTMLVDGMKFSQSANQVYTLDYHLPARVMENCGRAKGLSSFGSIPTAMSTYTQQFPTNFFQFTPIVQFRILRTLGNGNFVTAGTFLTPNIWMIGNEANDHTYGHLGESLLLDNFILTVGSTYFSVVPDKHLGGHDYVIYWHAFGV